jgi:hypothetical protein
VATFGASTGNPNPGTAAITTRSALPLAIEGELPISTAISSRCPAVADIESSAWQKIPLQLLILLAQEETGQLAVYVAVVQIFNPKKSNIYNYYISFLDRPFVLFNIIIAVFRVTRVHWSISSDGPWILPPLFELIGRSHQIVRDFSFSLPPDCVGRFRQTVHKILFHSVVFRQRRSSQLSQCPDSSVQVSSVTVSRLISPSSVYVCCFYVCPASWPASADLFSVQLVRLSGSVSWFHLFVCPAVGSRQLPFPPSLSGSPLVN